MNQKTTGIRRRVSRPQPSTSLRTLTRTGAGRTARKGRTARTVTRMTAPITSAVGRRMPSTRTVLIGGAVTIGLGVTIAAARIAADRMQVRRAARMGERALDPLTGLPNHAEALWWLNRRMEQARARKLRLAVLVLDLDDFADCNETYGRAAGDHVLQVTGVRLQSLLRTGDIVCRTGNDTFVVIMDVDGPDHMVARIGERIVQAVAEPITFGDENIVMRSSVGFAISTDREADPELLLGRADRAVIQAKASERPIVQF